MTRITASALDRLAACPASAHLPQAHTVTPAGERGTVLHTYLEECHEMGADEALARVPEDHREACAALDLDALPAANPDAWDCEIALAWDVETGKGRVLPGDGDRDYSAATPTEATGTADVVGLTDDGGAVVVMDYKSGWSNVPRAAVNRQLRFYALASARAFGVDTAHVAIIRLRHGEAWYDHATFDALDLVAIAEEVRDVWRSVEDATAESPVTLGAHCRYCPALASCPGQMGIVREIVEEAAEADEDGVPWTLTDETIPEAFERLGMVKRLVERMDKALKDYVCQRGAIPSGNGMEISARAMERTGLKGRIVRDVLTAKYGDEVADAVVQVKHTATQTKLREVLAPIAKAGGVPVKRILDETLDEINQRGGTFVSSSWDDVRERRVKS